MNTAQLECFISLAGTLNYMKTADQLGLTQPAVSKQIKSLEEELGGRLFDRTTRSVSLTAIGQRFLPEANDMLNTYYHSREWISSFQEEGTQVLRIGYSNPDEAGRIGDVLAELRVRFPHLIPSLTCDQTDANLGRLQQGLLDLLLSMRDAKFTDDQVIFKKLRDERFRCVIAKDHPMAVQLTADPAFHGTVDTKALWDCDQILSIPPYLMKTFFSRGRHIVPVNDDVRNILCAGTNEALCLVRAGFGYAMIPEHLVLPDSALLSWTWAESPRADFGIYYRKSAASGKGTLLREYLTISAQLYSAISF